ncbi:serine/arginine repetitive matrix protein 2-like [Anopheles stephensi]|uniref:serine/arginine repetitive matrix protein 2-like n=1 Tax=Anopheles stephensi TaxID=30069 RepID=UPI001658A45A|nr:serine/arginine repetitive matrix protein 2-like [Anopheles stephensi]
MNAGLSKIHFVNTTGVSLNDRFTSMTKTHLGFGAVVPTMMEAPIPRPTSVAMADNSNRRLIDQWDRLHALHALATKTSPSNIRPARQRLQRNTLAQQMKRTMTRLPGGVRRLQRSNSFTDIATMNADRVELLQRVRGRTPTISSRLGASRVVPRGRSMQRGRSASRSRSTSRGRQPSLTRSNSQTNLQRAGSRTNLSRAGSRTNLSRAGSRTNLTRAGSRNGLNTVRKTIAPNDARRRINRNNLIANRLGTVNGAAAVTRGRSRSRSRVRGAAAAAAAATASTVAANAAAANGRARSRSRKRAGSRTRAASVNSRLGANRTNELAGRANGGRVTKRSRSIRRGAVNASIVGARPGRQLKREAPKRKGAKGGGSKAAARVANNGGGANGAAPGAGAGASGRRGRSRSRRENSRVRGRSASKNRTGLAKQQPKSREELDSELDQYMANTKSSLDKEMDQYMNGFGSARI